MEKTNMKDKVDYSKYKCPYSHLEKESGHKLHGPEGYQDTYSVWCNCGFRGPVFYLEPNDLGFELNESLKEPIKQDNCEHQFSEPDKQFCYKCLKYIKQDKGIEECKHDWDYNAKKFVKVCRKCDATYLV